MIADLITAYEELDIVGDGQVDREELRSFAQSKGAEFAFSDAGLDQFFNQFDTDHDGKVSKKEWLSWFMSITFLELGREGGN